MLVCCSDFSICFCNYLGVSDVPTKASANINPERGGEENDEGVGGEKERKWGGGGRKKERGKESRLYRNYEQLSTIKYGSRGRCFGPRVLPVFWGGKINKYSKYSSVTPTPTLPVELRQEKIRLFFFFHIWLATIKLT